MITIVTEGKSAKAFEALNQLNEDTLIKVIRNGEPCLVPQRDIVVGDILLVETGDKIIADGRLIKSNDLSVDESALTGESLPVDKAADAVCSDKTPVAERKNMLYSGCFVSAGNGRMVVTGVGNDTEFGLIAQELSSIEKIHHSIAGKTGPTGKRNYRAGSFCGSHCVFAAGGTVCNGGNPEFEYGFRCVYYQYCPDRGSGSGRIADDRGGFPGVKYSQNVPGKCAGEENDRLRDHRLCQYHLLRQDRNADGKSR